MWSAVKRYHVREQRVLSISVEAAERSQDRLRQPVSTPCCCLSFARMSRSTEMTASARAAGLFCTRARAGIAWRQGHIRKADAVASVAVSISLCQ
jgi:hypothetical protein